MSALAGIGPTMNVDRSIAARRSIKFLNESALNSYQTLSKFDTNSLQVAETQTKRVQKHLGKMKEKHVQSHLNSFLQMRAK